MRSGTPGGASQPRQHQHRAIAHCQKRTRMCFATCARGRRAQCATVPGIHEPNNGALQLETQLDGGQAASQCSQWLASLFKQCPLAVLAAYVFVCHDSLATNIQRPRLRNQREQINAGTA